jgi:hypothetical protein
LTARRLLAALGMALVSTDSHRTETRPITDYSAQRDSCLEIASTVGQSPPRTTKLVGLYFETHRSKLNYGIVALWARNGGRRYARYSRQSKLFIVARYRLIPQWFPPSSESGCLFLATSRKRAASRRRKAPSTQPKSNGTGRQQPTSAADRTEAASRRLS